MDDDTKPTPKTDGTKPTPKTAAVAAPEMPTLAIGESSGNLTRDSIIETTRGKLMERGTSEADAHKQAVKRGYEMIRD
jgi:hypothetical protein